ncbi:MAG: hypothetical protein J5I90_00260 [Caldilineales bacterium]|nr:hypothetical protein [Caldilineales bacterium]
MSISPESPTNQRKFETLGLIILGVGVLALVDLIFLSEKSPVLRTMAGQLALPVGLTLALIGVYLTFRRLLDRVLGPHWYVEALLGIVIVLLGLMMVAHLRQGADNYLAAQEGLGGGLVGWALAELAVKYLGPTATWIVVILAIGAGAFLIFNYTPMRFIQWQGLHLPVFPGASAPSENRALPPSRTTAAQMAGAVSEAEKNPAKPKPDQSKKQAKTSRRARMKSSGRRKTTSAPSASKRSKNLPPLELLHDKESGGATQEQAQIQAELIEDTLQSFGIPARVVEINVGPSVTQFGVEPGSYENNARTVRVRVNKIVSLSDDLALALAASPVRIEAPVPGRPFLGIEVPNAETSLVSLRRLLEDRAFRTLRSPLAIPIGRDVSGDAVAVDLSGLPHLLIAGATGSGKSVALNSIICALLFNNGPDVVKFILVDPKRVELPGYNGIPHLIAPVVTDPQHAEGALTWLLITMDERYRMFSEVGVRNIQSYNRKVKPSERLPYNILIVDELADLMVTAPDSIETKLVRLAQMARATGIHLVIATQRPSVDVVTGLIKANFPARLAFSVTSQIDSRVILDTPGADKLLGRGDGLLMTPDSAKLQRIQGCFVSDSEISALVKWWRENSPTPERDPTKPLYPWSSLMVEEGSADELFHQTVEKLRGRQSISTSSLQRLMGIGYPRAQRLMDELEREGVIGPEEDRRTGRPILLEDEDFDD